MILELTPTLFHYWIANAPYSGLTSRPTRGFSPWFWCNSRSANLNQKWEKRLSHPSWSQISQRFLPAASDSLELNLEPTTTAKLTEASNRSNGHIVRLVLRWGRVQCNVCLALAIPMLNGLTAQIVHPDYFERTRILTFTYPC